MIPKHPYCRTCGSVVQSKSVCHYCGCDPSAGHNYCSDCGTSTIAEAIMCVHCGASFQKRFPAAMAIIFSLAVVVIFSGIGLYLNQSSSSEPVVLTSETATNNSEEKEKSIEPAEANSKNKKNNNVASLKKN